MHDQLRQAPVTSRQARDYLRVFLSGASDELPDKQGRISIPPMLRKYAGLERDVAVIGTGTRVEIWDLHRVGDVPGRAGGRLRRHRGGGLPERPVLTTSGRTTHRRPVRPPPESLTHFPGVRGSVGDLVGRRRGRPTTRIRAHLAAGGAAMSDDTTTARADDAASRHTPVLLQRCLDLLAPAFDVEDAVHGGLARSAWAATPRASCEAFPHVAGRRPGPRHAGARARGPAAGAVRRPLHAACTRSTTRSTTCSTGWASPASRACSWTSASRRCSSTSASAASPTRPTRRSTCAWTPRPAQTAADVLNTYDERELARILRGVRRGAVRAAHRPGDRRAARHGARWSARASSSSIVRANIPAATRKTGGNPAKRTFQALRIEVNGEIEVLERALPAVDRGARRRRPDRRRGVPLARGPRRQAGARRRATSSAPPDLPVEPETHAPFLRLVTRGAEEADEAELAHNPRSQSVRLRAAERVRPTPDHLKPRQTGRRAA